jgi:hypothetical protein
MQSVNKGDRLTRNDGTEWIVAAIHPPFITARRRRGKGVTVVPVGGGRAYVFRETELEAEGFSITETDE